MQHRITNAGVAFVRVEMTRIAPPLMTTTEHLVDLLHTIQSLPLDERDFVELDEDSFTMDLVGWHPIWLAA